jgi:hypothetical protein
MIVIRVVKPALVAAIALLVSLVAFGNLTDYDTNFVFVQHVMSMDTIYPFSTIRYRAISAPALHHAAYALIIAAELNHGGSVLDRRSPACASNSCRCTRVQSSKDLRHRRTNRRVPALASRIHLHRGRVVWDVAVATVERRPQRIPVLDDHHRCSNLRDNAGS